MLKSCINLLASNFLGIKVICEEYYVQYRVMSVYFTSFVAKLKVFPSHIIQQWGIVLCA